METTQYNAIARPRDGQPAVLNTFATRDEAQRFCHQQALIAAGYGLTVWEDEGAFKMLDKETFVQNTFYVQEAKPTPDEQPQEATPDSVTVTTPRDYLRNALAATATKEQTILYTDTDTDRLHFQASDGRTTAAPATYRSSAGQVQGEPFSVSISAKPVIAWLKALGRNAPDVSATVTTQQIARSAESKGETITTYKEFQVLRLRSGRSEFQAIAHDAEPLAVAQPRELVAAFNAPYSTLKTALERAYTFASREEMRNILTGIAVEITAKTVRLITTDTHRLAVVNVDSTDIEAHSKEPVMIPPDALKAIKAAKLKKDELLTVRFFANETRTRTVTEYAPTHYRGEAAKPKTKEITETFQPVEITSEYGTVYAGEMETGMYPKYEKVIPKTHEHSATFNRADLLKTVETLKPYWSQNSSQITLSFRDGLTAIMAISQDTGRANEVLPTTTKGTLSFALNAVYLIDFLKASKAELITLQVTGALNPILFSAPEFDRAVLMPMQADKSDTEEVERLITEAIAQRDELAAKERARHETPAMFTPDEIKTISAGAEKFALPDRVAQTPEPIAQESEQETEEKRLQKKFGRYNKIFSERKLTNREQDGAQEAQRDLDAHCKKYGLDWQLDSENFTAPLTFTVAQPSEPIAPTPKPTPQLTERPLAAPGLVSYRCRNRFGYTMIGARDDADALNEARRSDPEAKREDLEVWDGATYVPCVVAHSTEPEASEPEQSTVETAAEKQRRRSLEHHMTGPHIGSVQAKTVLMPHIIAEQVLSAGWDTTRPYSEYEAALEHLVARADYHFTHNQQVRDALMGTKGRDERQECAKWMLHWAQGMGYITSTEARAAEPECVAEQEMPSAFDDLLPNATLNTERLKQWHENRHTLRSMENVRKRTTHRREHSTRQGASRERRTRSTAEKANPPP